MRKASLVLIRRALLALVILFAREAYATTRYVSTAGSDSNSCSSSTSSSTPKQHFTGVSGALACMSGSDTLIAAAGTYAESIDTTTANLPSGSAGSPTIIKAASGATVWIQPASGNFGIAIAGSYSYITFDGINIDNINTSPTTNASSDAIKLSFIMAGGPVPDHIVVQNAEIKNATMGILTGADFSLFQNLTIHDLPSVPDVGQGNSGYGMYMSGSDNVVVRNYIHDVGGWGLQQFHQDGTGGNRNVLAYNRIAHSCTAIVSCAGILLSTGDSNLAYNNIVYGGSYGIGVGSSGGGTNSKAFNNTFYGNSHDCVVLGATDSFVQNNICYGNGRDLINNVGATTPTTNHNLFTNPSFLDTSTNNFRLQAGSAAIDAGTNIAAVPDDFDNVLRPQPFPAGTYDIGAFEFVPDGGGGGDGTLPIAGYDETHVLSSLIGLSSSTTVDNVDGVCQSYTPSQSVTLAATKFWIQSFGSPTMNVVSKIYAKTGTCGSTAVPTGSALATSDNVAASSVPSTLGWKLFPFSGANQIAQSTSTCYEACIEYSSGNNSDFLIAARDPVYVTDPGNYAAHTSGTWGADANKDLIFSVQGTPTQILVFSVQPANVASGSNFSSTVTVLVKKPDGTTTDTASSAVVTLTMSGCGSALTGGQSLAASSGVAAFSPLGAITAGTGCVITASSPNIASAASSSFNVTVSSSVTIRSSGVFILQ